MRINSERTILTVQRCDGAWAVEHDGQLFGHSRDKEVAKAAANKHAREIQDRGGSCQVLVTGEHGFFPVR